MNDSVAAFVAHPDDEVLGCGGSLARLAAEGREVNVLVLADGEASRKVAPDDAATAARIRERSVAARAACATLGCASIDLRSWPDNRLDAVDLLDIVQCIEAFVQQHLPRTVFTHYGGDVNVDHRIVHDAVLAACRPQPGHSVRELFFFEVPSSTEWRPPGSLTPFNPNWFVDISTTLTKKIDALRAYQGELRPFPHPRSIEGVEALARWRGATVGVRAAEAFVLGRKIS